MECVSLLLVSIILGASSQFTDSSSQVPSLTNIYNDREDGDFGKCVCQSRIVINPPVCRRSDQVSSTSHRENVSSVLRDAKQELEELKDVVKENQETVAFDLGDIKHQLKQLQVSVLGIVRIVNNDSSPRDCSEALARGMTESGVYPIQPRDSGGPIDVYCDMETDGGGWTVFQRRKDGSVDFYLDFANYSRGFGNLEGEFWLGNDNLHLLTAQGEYELHVDLADFENESRYAVYDSFSIAGVRDKYRLTLGSYSGTAGDSLGWHNSHQFTTKDRDNDASSRNCAQANHGAWWYSSCHDSNLNGEYLSGTTTRNGLGVVWEDWKGNYYSLKTTEMKIRPTR